jgi:hypothetical protein
MFVWAFTVLIALLIISAYFLTLGNDITFSYLLDEISGRIFIAQVAGVFMTLSVFPDKFNFIGLDGINIWATAFDFPQSEGVPRIVMRYFWPTEVDSGLLGYMSSYFPSEAYGNFGVLGVLIAPFFVGMITIAYIAIFMRLRNVHLGSALVIYIIFNLPYTSNFTAFYYNPGLLLLIFSIVIFDSLTTPKSFAPDGLRKSDRSTKNLI